MEYYLKIGRNTRIIRPGDCFIAANRQNYTYDEMLPLSLADKEVIGIFELEEDDICDQTAEFILKSINEIRNTRILNNFRFRDEPYTCTTRDGVTIDALLNIAKDKSVGSASDIGNINWLDDDIPFFWVTSHGNIRNMDIPTFKDFAKSMTLHVMAHNAAAMLIQHNISNGVEFVEDNHHWPDHHNKTPAESYKIFAKALIEAKYGLDNSTDADYQNQINDIASMIE